MAQRRSTTIQDQGVRLVFGDAATGGEQVSEVVHRPVQPGLGGDSIMLHRNRGIRLTAPTMFVATAEHVACHQMPLPGGNAEPAQRQGLILRDTLTIEQDLPKQRLRLDNSLARRQQNRLRRTTRALFKHGAELFAVEDFLTAQMKTHTSTQRRSKL